MEAAIITGGCGSAVEESRNPSGKMKTSRRRSLSEKDADATPKAVPKLSGFDLRLSILKTSLQQAANEGGAVQLANVKGNLVIVLQNVQMCPNCQEFRTGECPCQTNT